MLPTLVAFGRSESAITALVRADLTLDGVWP